MTGFVTVNVQGLPELQHALAQVASNVERRYAYVATAAAAGVIKNAVIANAPVWHGDVSKGHPPPGTLKRSIAIGRSRGLGRGVVGYFVYVRSGKKEQKKGRDAYYWKWVEFGHYTKGATGFKNRAGARGTSFARYVETGGARFIPPQSFMRSSFDANWRASLDRFVDKLGDQLRNDGFK